MRNLPGGERVVVSEQKLATGGARVVAYREKTSPTGQTVSRVYADGHRSVQGQTFHSEAVGRGPQFVKYNNGLHAAYLANGRPLYTERLATRTIEGGRRVSFVERTTYTSIVLTNGAVQSVPIVRYYPLAVTVGAVAFYAYQPIVYQPEFYVPLYQPFVTPLVVVSGCLICPPAAVVAFQQPTPAYTDPMDLVGDNVIADGAIADAVPPANTAQADALASAPPAEPGTDVQADVPPPPPEVVAAESASGEGTSAELVDLRSEAKDLTQSVDANAATQPELAGSGQDARAYNAALTGTGQTNNADSAAPLAVPEYARIQLRKEVRFDVAMQRNGHMLLLPTIIKSDYGKIFVFQAASPIDVTVVADGSQCTLASGDLIGFSRVPAGADPVAQMKVISSHAGHCQGNETVEVAVSDLQDMLNAFSERVEREMKRTNACMSSGGACVGT